MIMQTLKYRKWKKIIEQSNMFDKSYYLFTYPDVRLSDIDPIEHYIKSGAKEGRNPSQEFDTNYYYQTYEDVEKSGMNPLLHYIRYGQQEGRVCTKTSGVVTKINLLTLVTPLYNTPIDYLEELVLDVAKIDEYVEWILVNDSPNNQELKAYVMNLMYKYPFIKYYENEKNLGIYGSYLNGFKHASSQYCAILDHDDRVFISQQEIELLKEGEYDILYTNEYKFEEILHPFDHFHKPQVDLLSIFYYFYTHHFTYLKTDTVLKTIPSLEEGREKYSSIFDLCWLFEYLKEFNLKDVKVKQIEHFSYGWRVHENSTAKSIAQKPIAYVERVKKADELFRYYGEAPLVYINERIPYSVVCKFTSADELLNLSGLLNEQLNTDEWLNGLEYNIMLVNIGSIEKEFLKILYYFPLRLLIEHLDSSIFIPLQSEAKYEKAILDDVPYYIELERQEVATQKGILIDINPNSNIVNYLVIKKDFLNEM